MAKARINLSGLKKQVQNLRLLRSEKGMSLIGIKVLELNNDQISKQIDANGKRFPAYSERYQKVRSSKGRDNRVDLVGFPTEKGQASMLVSFGVQRVEPGLAVVGFPNQEEKRKALGVLENKKRPIPFVGLTSGNRRKLIKFVVKRFGLLAN